MPAGRSSITMPSGVSADTTVSSDSIAVALATGSASSMRGPDVLRFHDDRIRDLVVQALARVAEDETRIDDPVDVADIRNGAGDAVHEVAQPEDAAERRARAIRAHDLDADDLLRDGLAVLVH